MDPNDPGYFGYNDAFPPLCVRPPGPQLPAYEQAMNGAINKYLQDSLRTGLKSAHTVLPNGLTAGEAGVIHFRGANLKRRQRESPTGVERQDVLARLAELLQEHFQVDFNNPDIQSQYNEYMEKVHFTAKNHRRVLTQAVKTFLVMLNLKTKGYTSKLRQVMTSLANFVTNKRQQT